MNTVRNIAEEIISESEFNIQVIHSVPEALLDIDVGSENGEKLAELDQIITEIQLTVGRRLYQEFIVPYNKSNNHSEWTYDEDWVEQIHADPNQVENLAARMDLNILNFLAILKNRIRKPLIQSNTITEIEEKPLAA